jgi:hypothetical protein
MQIVDSVKEFLKPDWRKVLVAVILLCIVIIYSVKTEDLPFNCPSGSACGMLVQKKFSLGYPLVFYTKVLNTTNEAVNYFYLIFDLIFWYLISCIIISVWDNIKNKKNKFLVP